VRKNCTPGSAWGWQHKDKTKAAFYQPSYIIDADGQLFV
jgi:hypothetical protein